MSEPGAGAANPSLLRPVAPTGAPAVGEPPVSVRAIGRLLDRGEDPQAAFPHLSPAELGAARAAWGEDPQGVSPRATWSQALSLVPSQGGGALIFVQGVVFLGSLPLALLAGSDRARLEAAGTIGLGVGLAGLTILGLGLGLLRLAPWARRLTGGLATLVALVALIASVEDLSFTLRVLPTALLLGLVLLAASGRWFGPDGRAAAHALPLRPYQTVAALGAALLWASLTGIPVFREAFLSMGVALPRSSQLMLDLAQTVEAWSFLMPPLVVLAPLPLLRLRSEQERAAWLAALLACGVAFGSIAGGLLLPIVQLMQAS